MVIPAYGRCNCLIVEYHVKEAAVYHMKVMYRESSTGWYRSTSR